ncbi:MAG: glycosyltransferase, partial [Candidatus Korarchaeota archaeon]|nr:glycosyltransferase [Candidatus Korarchaeota archaeon]
AGLGMMRRINDLYKEQGFDVTHAHSLFSPLAMLTSYVSRGIRDVPVVATNHSILGSPRLGFAYRPLVRFMARKVDVFIAVSSVVAEDTRRLLGGSLGDRNIMVVHNGIDTGFWRPPSPGERGEARRRLGVDDRLVVGVVARLTRRKRVDLVPELASRLGSEVVFLVAGDGPQREELLERAERLGVRDRIVLLGFVPRERVREVLWASDVFLSPGELEACPIAVIEARAAGVPVVGRNRSGVGDIVVQGETGLLFDEVWEAAEHLSLLLGDEAARRRMAAASRRRAEEAFSWASVAGRSLEAYRRALEAASEVDRHMLLHRAWLRVRR